MTYAEEFTVGAMALFDFGLSARIFGSGDKQIRTFSNGVFSQVLRIGGKPVLANVRSTGTVEEPKISIG